MTTRLIIWLLFELKTSVSYEKIGIDHYSNLKETLGSFFTTAENPLPKKVQETVWPK
jgi:hypothetical protein